MAYGAKMNSNYMPGGLDDDYYMPPPAPELISPEPQRHMPEMSSQIQHGLQNMSLGRSSTRSTLANEYRQEISNDLTRLNTEDEPHLTPFPKLVNPPPNVPPSDEDFESTLENARTLVLGSNDPEMQLAWAADALVYVGVCADNEERNAAAKPKSARPATPRVEHQLKRDSMSIVTFLADQHHPKAEFLRGMWLEWGRFGQREDKKEAFRCYSRAADKGYARAEYRIGMLYESYNDPVKALRHYHRGAEAGDAASCYRLGMMTLRGQHGQQQDWKRAIELIRQSAENADENAAQGAYVYGLLLSRQLPQVTVPDGQLPYDEGQAKMYIEKAAYLKFAKAQLKMGSSYELGALGCDFDPALSIHYNALASKQGEPEADMAISKWFLVGHEGLFPKNEELAYNYAERAAATGLATAEFALGYFHEIGVFVPVDLDRSKEWYEKAAKHGNEDAKGRLDGLSKRQVLSKKDHETVAISRIKSQHASMRGSKPSRFQQQAQPSRLGQLAETGPAQSPPSPAYPARSASITPYPVDDHHLSSASISRPPTVTPYPISDFPVVAPDHRTGPTGGFWAGEQASRPATIAVADQRPSSAFQLAPDYRPDSLSTAPQYGRPYSSGTPSGLGPGQRPATAIPPQARPTAGQRMVSSPVPTQYGYQNQAGSQAHPVPSRPGHTQRPAANPTPAPSPRVDIGFSAPNDNRRFTPYAQAAQHQSKPQQQPQPLRPSGSTPNFPTPKPSAPQQPNVGAPRPPPKSSSTPSQNPSASSKPQPSQPRPPGKGPKTFEEMGLQGQNKDQDCVVM